MNVLVEWVLHTDAVALGILIRINVLRLGAAASVCGTLNSFLYIDFQIHMGIIYLHIFKRKTRKIFLSTFEENQVHAKLK